MLEFPTYTVELYAVKAKTPEVGKEVDQEQYDEWISDPNHKRFEGQCQEGRIWFWSARIVEHVGDQHKVKEIYDTPFDRQSNNGTVQLREFMKDISKLVYKKAQHTLGEETQLIIPGRP